MRKLFISLSLMTLTLSGIVSCSSDDSNKEKKQLKTMVLTVNSTTVEENDQVTFTVLVGQELVEGVEIYIDGKLGTNPFIFDKMGSYKVIAKKEGYYDSNELLIKVTKAVEVNSPIIGKWIPTEVTVNIPMSESLVMPYPNQEDCDEDNLTFSNDNQVKFIIHDENCEVSSTGTSWVYNESTNKLTFTLFDQQMVVSVVSNTTDKLVIKAMGDQFAPLIPIFAPDLATDLPPAILALIEVQLKFKK